MRFKAKLALGAGAAALLMAGAFPVMANNGASSRTYGTSTASCDDGTVTASPAILWPPNHKMHTVTISYFEGPNQDGSYGDKDSDNISLSDISATESDLGSPGAGQPTVMQSGGADYSVPAYPDPVPDSKVWSINTSFRAERSGTDGNGSGRVYAISVKCHDDGGTDAVEATTGNSNTATVFVCVPHDQSQASRAFCDTSIKTGS